MKFFGLLFVLAVAFAHNFPEDDGIVVLNDSTFDAAIEEFGSLLVEFYAPWCGHCKKLAPEYALAAKQLAELDTPLNIAKVDATANPKLSEKYKIQGFPTLKFFRGESISDYEGGRVAKDIVDYVVRKSGPIGKLITEASQLESLKESNDVVFVAAFAEESETLKNYLTVAGSIDDLIFAYIVTPEVAESLNVEFNTISVYKKFDEEHAVMEGEITIANIQKFAHKHELPLIIPFNQKNARKIFNPASGIDTQCIIFAEEGEEGKADFDTFRKVSAVHQGEAFFINIPVDNTRLMDYFGVSVAELPAIVVAKSTQAGMKKYKFDREFTEEDINNYLADYFTGKLTPFLKSEAIPAEQNEPVYQLVGKSFNDIALDASKNVFVLFYAPWCGHCKALHPTYKELAEKLADRKDIIIAKIDATANEVDHPEVSIRGFPTLKFFQAETNKVIAYEGDRTLDSLMKFVLDNSIEVEADAQPEAQPEAEVEAEL